MNNPRGNTPQGQMHPEDKRNLIVFFVICIAAFVLYDVFIHQPKMKALEAARAAQAVQAKIAAQTPAIPGADAAGNLPVETALAANARITIDNPDLSGSLSLKGGRIDDLALRQYFTTVERETPVTLLAPSRTEYPLYVDIGWLGDNVPGADTVWRAAGEQTLSKDSAVTLTWNNGRGLNFERTYKLDEHYMFTVTDTVRNTTNAAVTLHPYALVSRQGMPADFAKNAVMHEGPIGFIDGELQELTYKDLDKKPRQDFSGNGWAGFSDKYWFTGLIHAGPGTPGFRFLRGGNEAKPTYQVDMTGEAITIAPGASTEMTTKVFAGPKKLDILNQYRDTQDIARFDLVIDFGMFWFMTIPFFHILTWLGHSFGSFAVAILVFTVILRLAVFPLANKSYRAFARMRKIQPQMLEIREKYGQDRAKLQQAIFELYKRENVNPMAGCLPILIQIPIFFALYKVLYITLEMRHAPFWGWINDMSAPDPLSVFTLFGLIDWTPPQFMIIGAWPLIMGLTMYMQQRMNPPVQDPIQAKVLGFMPVFITALMAHFPAGLVIYWSWSNFLSIIQQYVLMRQEGVEVHFFRRSPMDKKMEEAVAHGPAVHPEAEELKHDLEAIEGKVLEKTISPPKPTKKR